MTKTEPPIHPSSQATICRYCGGPIPNHYRDCQAPQTNSPSTAPCEISVVNDAFNAHISEKPRSYESFADYREGFFEGFYTASTEPVSGSPVSLAKCKWELSKVFVPNGIWNIDEGMKMERAVKAVLDTAGVKYVE